MNERTYKIAYRSTVVSQLQDPEDIATALADIYLTAVEDYDNYKFSKVKKTFSPEEVDIKDKHDSALTLLMGLTSDSSEIIEQWPNQNDRNRMHEIYDQERRGRILPSSPLNELNTKLSNIKKIVEYMKELYPLVIRRTFFYQDHKLFIDMLKPIPFRPYSDNDIVLTILFKRPFRVWKHIELQRLLIKKRPILKSNNSYRSISKPLKNAIEEINSRVGENYNEYKDQKIIIQAGGFVSVNTNLFHIVDRLNRKT
ncbi:MAG: hypothetical protein WAZ21_00640 [Candidatus Saccharimonadales bacterium]